MKTCQTCNMGNRAEARYCKWCGSLIQSVSAGAQGGERPETDGFIAKDNILKTFEEFARRCEQTIAFRKLAGNDARPGLDCTIAGEAGTGKKYLAAQLCSVLYRFKISDKPNPMLVDAADWDEFNSKLDENLASIKKGVLFVTNCQMLLDEGGRSSRLDKLFARMRQDSNMPVVMLSGLDKGFGNFMSDNRHISSLFEFHFKLNSFRDCDLTRLCVETLRGKFRTDLSPEAEKKISLVMKKRFRDGDSGENGGMAYKMAEECTINMLSRGGRLVEEEDVHGEPFKEMTEEEIFAELDKFVGLKEVKQEIRSIVDSIKFQKQHHPDQKVKLDSHYVFLGNPGTGKTSVARLFADILNSLQVLPSGHLVEAHRDDFVSQYSGETAIKTEQLINRAMGGVLFIDEAYALKQSDSDKYGQEAIDTLLPYLENRLGDFVCIIAGYTSNMNSFLRSNPGLESRFRKKIIFKDYTSAELKTIFMNMADSNGYSLDEESSSKIDKFFEMMYLKRTDHFGNAREVRNAFNDARSRMQSRIVGLSQEEYEKTGNTFIWEDIAGPEDSRELSVDDVMKELDDFVGMESVKNAIRTLAQEMSYRKLLMESGRKASIRPVNIILTGNPGTGKSTVARVFGKLFKAMGVCSTEHVVEKTRKDIVGRYANEADKEMDKAVNEAMGGVLFLDEAYELAPFDDMGNCSDSEGLKALGTLLTRMENDAGKFVLVCAGYKHKMDNLLKANEGFASRFTHRIHIEDYTPGELTEIFRRSANRQGYELGEGTLDKVMSAFRQMIREAAGGSFGNAREARTMLNDTVGRIAMRVAANPDSLDSAFTILPEDIPYEEPKEVSEEECMEQLGKLVGLDSVKKEIRFMVEELKQRKLEAEMEGKEFEGLTGDHYLFLGNPGTGKTTVARLMGNIFHSLGVLPKADVIEVSRSDMVASFQGQTAPKTREVVNRAMGGVLFIDEAYSLIQGEYDSFGNESVTELLKLLEDRKGRFVCIAAGYTREMGRFLDSNSGLRSRFNKVLEFADYSGDELMQIFRDMAEDKGYTLDPEAGKILAKRFEDLCAQKSGDFGNGREARNIFANVRSAVSKRANAEIARLMKEGKSKAEAYAYAKVKTILPEDLA